MYEYKFIEAQIKKVFRVKTGDTFEQYKNLIKKEAKNGWRLRQVIVLPNENTGL